MTARKPKWFGGKGTRQPIGDASNDPIGTVRRSPDGRWIAIMWPSRPHPSTWAITDYAGAAGYEKPERIAHWPIVGSVPCSPAAGMPLNRHKEDSPDEQLDRVIGVVASEISAQDCYDAAKKGGFDVATLVGKAAEIAVETLRAKQKTH
ncbi:hypothetical protein JOF56_011641 [Kibdelosporangium banguiense]|uniref:ANTAR domain-containing protein n=1 Tax=Kibdelosporangium banguiense TaxID=1365924 RepID=A0ABS4U4Y2_9PSEU|nr:hypothetical protein [Kibdelosporangium banguiense]MBP2331256.1 hypothetical protein [Kibdelosporangium banguiense]